jgi:hypothetical protein
MIADELKKYPEIELKWHEKGLQFQVQFIKKNYQPEESIPVYIDDMGMALRIKLGLRWDQVGTKSALSWRQVIYLLDKSIETTVIQSLMWT